MALPFCGVPLPSVGSKLKIMFFFFLVLQVRHGVVMRDSDHEVEQAAGLPDLSSSSSSSEED